MHGYYHGETRKDPISPARNRASLGYAYSDDGGRTWTKPGHPDNRIITGQNGNDYAGDGHLVVRADHLYMYFGQFDGEYLALSKLADKGLPGTWRTWVRSDAPGEIETVPSTQSNGSILPGLRYAAFVTWNTHLKRWLAVDGEANGEKDRPLILKVSDDGINWSKLSEAPPPVLPQTHPKLTLYPSLVGLTGEAETGQELLAVLRLHLTSPNMLARVRVTLGAAPAGPR